MSKGTLVRDKEGIWMVKWSDLHSFGQGTHWMYTQLSPYSIVIPYVKDKQIMYKPLEEDLEVQFEHIPSSYDKQNLNPFQYAKLTFPDVIEFKKEERIKEYINNGGELFIISRVDTIRDGGTISIHNLANNKPIYYIHKNDWTLHHGYPTTDENKVTDKATQFYILDRLWRYKRDCEHNHEQANRIIEKIKL